MTIVASLVDTVLQNVADTRSVRILVNGEPAESLGGHVDLTRPLLYLRGSSLRDARARPDGRKAAEMRAVAIETGATRYAEGSALISLGFTRVLCTASIEDRVPPS